MPVPKVLKGHRKSRPRKRTSEVRRPPRVAGGPDILSKLERERTQYEFGPPQVTTVDHFPFLKSDGPISVFVENGRCFGLYGASTASVTSPLLLPLPSS
jgi:hypothetical protein